MKRYTTRSLKSISVLFMSFPLSYLIIGAILFDVPAKQCLAIVLSPTYWIMSGFAIAAGYGLWEMKHWSWYVFVISNILILYNTAIIAAERGETHHKALAFIVALIAQVALFFRVAREIRVPYFLPKIRWWESNPRYKLVVASHLLRGGGEPEEAEILDLSYGGCFVKTRIDVRQDEVLTVRFTLFGEMIELPGTVVWRTQSGVTHPRGIGVKFLLSSKGEKKLMKAVNNRLKKIARLYRTSRYLMTQEDFFKKMEALQTQKLAERATERQLRA